MVRSFMEAALPTFLTVDELAAILRCQPEKVYRLAARGELPSYKVEGRRLFSETEVGQWLEQRRVGVGSSGFDPR
jgi:excisionase family DNA binding protein